MMLVHKLRQLRRLVRWRREVRQAVSMQLAMLEAPGDVALGTLTAADEARLVALVQRAAAHPGPIVEIGTLFGLTTRVIIAEASPAQHVITVDNFSWNPFGITPAMHEQFARSLLRAELASGRLAIERADSAAFRAAYRGPAPALVFLDADHSYAAVRDEIAWARGLRVPIICGHDYGVARFGVSRAVDEAFGPGGVVVSGTVWSWERPA